MERNVMHQNIDGTKCFRSKYLQCEKLWIKNSNGRNVLDQNINGVKSYG